MKKIIIILFLVLTTTSWAQGESKKWKAEIDLGGGFSFTTFLEVSLDNKQFLMTSPKNADIRLFGFTKATAGRLLGKSPKKGIFFTIKGNQEGDSLIGKAKSLALGEMEFKGVLTGKRFNGEFIKNDSIKIGSLTAVKTKEDAQIDHQYLYNKIIEITENNIYSGQILQTKEWKKFTKELKKLCDKAKDDIELYLGFKMLSHELPFSHYYLILQEGDNVKVVKTEGKSVVFEEKNSTTAYLKIKNFSDSEEEITAVLPQIIENKNYKNLIVDLRDNPGGGVEAAKAFGRYILNEPVKIGYFPTNKLEYSGFDAALFETLPETQATTTEGLIAELKKTKGVKLAFKPHDNPVFMGNLYILTNGNTGSTCEPIVYVLKKNKRATVIGEKTAGAMLSGTIFEISGKYKLFLPVADFYTYDGVRLEGVGVSPDIEVPSKEALDKALFLIKENK